jgi:hypothetical protein
MVMLTVPLRAGTAIVASLVLLPELPLLVTVTVIVEPMSASSTS